MPVIITAHQPELEEAVCYDRTGLLSRGVLLFHDNAWLHIVYTTGNALEHLALGDFSMSPSCTPDLAPFVFHMFPKMKHFFRSVLPD